MSAGSSEVKAKELPWTKVFVVFTQEPKDWGWLRLSVELRHGDDPREWRAFDLLISGVFCPMADYLAWLEEIATGSHEAVFDWDAERGVGKLLVRGDTLTLKWGGDEATAHVYRRQLVAAFYDGFRSFVRSSRYDAVRYEELPTMEAVARERMHPALFMPSVLSRVAALERSAAVRVLERLLRDAHPRQATTERFPRRPQTRSMVLKALGLVRHRPFRPMKSRKPASWIGPDWNHAPRRARFRALAELMKVAPRISYSEYRLANMRSDVVERWIGQSVQGRIPVPSGAR